MFPVVEHPESVVIVVVDGDELICVSQTRPGARGRTLELPSGKLERLESPEEAARRELAEECGLTAGSLRAIGTFWVVPAYSTELTHVFQVTSHCRAEPGHKRDDDEDIELVRVSITDALGRLSDAASLAAFALWKERRLGPGLL